MSSRRGGRGRPTEAAAGSKASRESTAGEPTREEVWQLVPAPLREPFRRYLDLLLRWNGHIDLVAPASEPVLVARHLLDALQLLVLVPPGPARVLDLGSGAGLPGIPWAMARPELQLVLAEPRAKRAAFLRTAARELGLGLEVREERGEQLIEAGETFDVAVARALAPWPRWPELAVGLLRPAGTVHAQAGAEPPPGWNDPAFCAPLGLVPEEEHVYRLPGHDLRRALRLRLLQP